MMTTQNSNPAGMQQVGMDVGLALVRVMLGVVFMFHGAQKLFGWFGGGGFSGTVDAFGNMGMPLPTVSAALAGGAEFFGGLALLLGLMTRFVAVPVAFTMFVAAFAVHGGTFSAQAGGMEYPLTLGVVTAALMFTGPGRLAADTFVCPFTRRTAKAVEDGAPPTAQAV